MKTILLLLRNGFRVDRRKFIPFMAMVVVVVTLVASVDAFKASVLASAWDPIVHGDGGDVLIMKSEKRPVYTMSAGGLHAVYSRQLMTRDDLGGLLTRYPSTLSLNIPGEADVSGGLRSVAVSGFDSLGGPTPRCSAGRLPNAEDAALAVQSGEAPVKVAIFPNSEALRSLKLGDRFRLTIPGIVPSGGAPYITGVYEMAQGIDYLDYRNQVTITVEVIGIMDESLSGSDRVRFHLNDLNRLTGGHDFINMAAINTGERDIGELARIGGEVEAELGSGFYALTVTDKMGMTGEMRALERHADRLMQMVFLICVLMMATAVVLIISYRRQQDAQLLFLGIGRGALVAAVVIQIAVISLCAVVLGLTLPSLMALRFRADSFTGAACWRYFTLVWVTVAVSAIVSLVLLPRKGDTLEVMRNE